MMDELTLEKKIEQDLWEKDVNDPYRTMPSDFKKRKRIEEDEGEDEEEIRAFC